VAIEATEAIGDEDPRVEDKSCALIKHGASEAERCPRVLRWMLGQHPYLTLQLSVFYHHAHRGIPSRW
jgi:hypothetical protein